MSQGRNTENRRNRNYQHHGSRSRGNAGEEKIEGKIGLEQVDPNSPVIKQFGAYAAELDEKHDRYEQIVKLSRDATIASKRIIFFLHTLDSESKKEAILAEAKSRLNNVASILFESIARKLDGQDPYQYLRAYRDGLQEYIEAITFFQYLESSDIQDWNYLQKSLTYAITTKNKANEEESAEENEETKSKDDEEKTLSVPIVPGEFILGVADLTGELMRKCINNLASGDTNDCFRTCNFVKRVYKGFLSCAVPFNKEMNKKIFTLRQSLLKMEYVCYTIKIRGSEIPKHMLADAANIASGVDYPNEDDEGYQAY